MHSENINSTLSFRQMIQKKMFHLKNMELFGIQTINILLKINLSIDIASQYNHPINNLAEIGIICDSNIIAFQKNKLSSTFYMSSMLIEKRLQNEMIFPIKSFTNEELSDEFLFLIKSINENVSNWNYFYIPFSIDTFHIKNLIEKKKCGIKSILKNIQDEIDNVSKINEKVNLKQTLFLNPLEKTILPENKKSEKNDENDSVDDKIFFKQICHKLPNKIENNESNDSSKSSKNNLIFRLNFGDFSNDFVANLNQAEPTLENIITDNSTIWKPFIL